MNSRERVINALEYRPVDAVPVEFHPSPSGFYDHGEKLRELIYRLPCDFEECRDTPIPIPCPDDILPDGSYHSFSTDEWGVVWEYRIFQMMGHPHKGPLEDMRALETYRLPPVLYDDPLEFNKLTAEIQYNKQTKFVKRSAGTIFQRMLQLRGYEAVLMDLLDDTEEINCLADRIVQRIEKHIDYYAKAGADAFSFFDDFGTQRDLMISKDTWDSFFLKRYRPLIKRAKDHGMKVAFHTCGQVSRLLDDYRRMGVDAVWPQLSVYDLNELAAHCRDLGLAVALHIDRSAVMTSGTPSLVKETVGNMAEAFKVLDGGSWFYIEIDNGFPFENIHALVAAVAPYTKAANLINETIIGGAHHERHLSP
jgi:hypothetical protein